MKETLHYLLMTTHLSFQKALMSDIRNTGLTSGQPKVLDYLLCHDGAVQKEIAAACHIEPATITSLLLGMENAGLISRRKLDGNRRSLYVYLTENGRKQAENIKNQFRRIEDTALKDFSDSEAEQLNEFLARISNNLRSDVK